MTCAVEFAATLKGTVRPGVLKPFPDRFAADTETVELPVLVSVIVRLELLPVVTFPNDKLVGEALIRNVEAVVAVPARVTVAFETLEVIATEPVKVPLALGENLIGSVAELPAAIVIGNVDPARLKPVPVTVAPLTESEEPPVFESVMLSVEFVPATRLPKLSEVGDTESWPGAAVTVTVADADFVTSAALVAVTVYVPAEPGAVNNPVCMTEPPLALHVTEVFVLPVTLAVNCCVPPVVRAEVVGEIVTTTGAGAAETITVADADLVGSATLVAVT